MRELALAPLERIRELFLQLLTSGNAPEGEEVVQRLPDGSVRWARTRADIVSEHGVIVRLWVTLRDITAQKEAELERRRLEEQLRQAQRLESIGLLAGGIAHDFNNLLFVVLNYAERARRSLRPDDATAHEALGAVLEAGQQAAELTRGLLAFSRNAPLSLQPLDLNELVRKVLGLLRRLLRSSVDIDFVPGHALGTIQGDPSALEQVLVNLCVNASDAISDVGRITLETENVVLNGAYVRAHPWARPGRYVLLTVSDDGEGMPAEVRERIFEPFFTTKPAGRGTGLGLAIVYGVVQRHEGMIHVYSEPGRGTTFKIYFPIVERPAVAVGAKLEGPVGQGTETILVAEDHSMGRELARKILEEAGYRVLVAGDGAEALRLLETHPEVDLMVLDVVMPKVTGAAVLRRLEETRPDLPVLLVSGHTGRVLSEELLAKHADRFLGKPFGADDLLRRVRSLLQGPGRG